MAERSECHTDGNFEILTPVSPMKTLQTFEFIEKDTPSSLINTNPLQVITIIENPVAIPIVRQSLDNSNCLPTRYGSAAIIPHDDGFDLKSVLNSKPLLFNQTDDLMCFLQNEKSRKSISKDTNLQQLLIDNNRDRQSLIRVARQAQQDFIDAIYLD